MYYWVQWNFYKEKFSWRGLIILYRKTRDGPDLLQDDHMIEYFMKMGITFILLTCSWHTRSEHCTWHKRKLALVQWLKETIYSKRSNWKCFAKITKIKLAEILDNPKIIWQWDLDLQCASQIFPLYYAGCDVNESNTGSIHTKFFCQLILWPEITGYYDLFSHWRKGPS